MKMSITSITEEKVFFSVSGRVWINQDDLKSWQESQGWPVSTCGFNTIVFTSTGDGYVVGEWWCYNTPAIDVKSEVKTEEIKKTSFNPHIKDKDSCIMTPMVNGCLVTLNITDRIAIVLSKTEGPSLTNLMPVLGRWLKAYEFNTEIIRYVDSEGDETDYSIAMDSYSPTKRTA